jgi:hypothetical protein
VALCAFPGAHPWPPRFPVGATQAMTRAEFTKVGR